MNPLSWLLRLVRREAKAEEEPRTDWLVILRTRCGAEQKMTVPDLPGRKIRMPLAPRRPIGLLPLRDDSGAIELEERVFEVHLVDHYMRKAVYIEVSE